MGVEGATSNWNITQSINSSYPTGSIPRAFQISDFSLALPVPLYRYVPRNS
jgi:hypothetical protein